MKSRVGGEDFSAVGFPILDTLRGVVKDRRRGVQELAARAPTLSR